MKRKISLIAALVVVAVILGGIMTMVDEAEKIGHRPNYCNEEKCLSAEFFENLPAFPSDFSDKKLLVYLGRITNLDIIEEKYWKQPEFYADSFVEQGIQHYYAFEPNKQVRFWSAGSGPYPGDIIVRNVSRGEQFPVKTFWHAAWAIPRHQIFSLNAEYPEKMTARMGDIVVEQNESTVHDCFTIMPTEPYVLLEPTYPSFSYNWTKKVALDIRTSDTCPLGWYGLHVVPTDPVGIDMELLEYKYGAGLSSMRVGGAWQIFIRVEH